MTPMESKQQTALEWYLEQVDLLEEEDGYLDIDKLFWLKEDAIQMEREQKREQIYKAFDAGSAYAIGSHADFKQTHPNKEQYYEQTYGTEQSH